MVFCNEMIFNIEPQMLNAVNAAYLRRLNYFKFGNRSLTACHWPVCPDG